jgi:hypothetical protein
MTRRTTATPLERAIAQARRDGGMRARILAGDRSAIPTGVPAADWEALLVSVQAMESELRANPDVATEADHGAADAAGTKN